MTHPHTVSRLLLTTVFCSVLTACGGDGHAPHGSYKGERADDRTAVMAQKPSVPLATRMDKIEHEVAMLRNDMSQLAVSYNGLVTDNERIDSVLAKVEAQQTAAPSPSVEKVDIMPPVKVEQPAPAKVEKKADVLPSAPTVMGVRLGEHGDKTRLVIDWSKLGDVKTDLDNGEKLLIITLSKTAWSAKEAVSGLSSPLVAGWNVQDSNGVKTMVVQLKKSVKLLNVGKLKADAGKPARIVIDIAAS